ncbi:MAG: CRISPR-associated endonuclease Cas1, partial [Chitinophagales bacterium]|nr:CRISPR-associated endonuclease Cas1 [Chitinophagales bacterium]
MKKSYYLFNPGELSRKDNTLKFTPIDEDGNEGQPKYIPIEDVDNLYVFGSLVANSALYNFLGKANVSVHFFDYYEHYTGSFMPKDYLLAGKVQVEQTRTYLKPSLRLVLAQRVLEGASFNMLKNLKYYNNRDKDLVAQITKIEEFSQSITISPSQHLATSPIQQLMGIEGNIRQTYYSAFDTILNDYEMGNRTKQPPDNEVNTLISFGNMLCYTACLDQIYHT